MRAVRLAGGDLDPAALEAGRLVLVHDLGPDLRKGAVLRANHSARLRAAPEVHAVELEPGDLHEDEAGPRLAAALRGPGVEFGAPVQSQVRLRASWRGLFRARVEAIDALNALGSVSVFTLVDGQAVEAGEEVAGCKVTPVAVPAALIEAAEEIGARPGARVEVVPFRPLRTLVIATERLRPRARELFAAAVERKLGWYGAELLGTLEVPRTEAGLRDSYGVASERQAELILLAGASAIDPLDPAYLVLPEAGGELLQVGAPMHPGSMLWLGRLGTATVLGVASCAGFGRSTSLDLVLPFVFAYGRAERGFLLRLGHGGLIETSAGLRFPPYESAAS